MGGFLVKDVLTENLIKEGEETLFIPLLGKLYDYYPKEEEVPLDISKVSNLGYGKADNLFDVFSFPIRGKYNGYGTLTNIIEDNNTRRIEKFFGISIYEFIDRLCYNIRDVGEVSNEKIDKKGKVRLLNNLGGTFIKRSTFDEIAEWQRKQNKLKKSDRFFIGLELLGFERDTSKRGLVLRKEGLGVQCTYCYFFKGKKYNNIEEFSQAWKKETEENLELNKLLKLDLLTYSKKCILSSIRNPIIIRRKGYFPNLRGKDSELLSLYKDNKAFHKLYPNIFRSEKELEKVSTKLIKFGYLISFMNNVGKPLMPLTTETDFGSLKHLKKLNKMRRIK